MDELKKLQIEEEQLLHNRPDLEFVSDFTFEGNRLFEIRVQIEKLKRDGKKNTL